MVNYPLQAIRQLLLASPALVTAVGQRVYLMQAAQNAPPPHIIIMPVSMTGSQTLEAYGKPSARITVDVRSTTIDGSSGASTIGTLVLDALDRFTGVSDGVTIDRIITGMDAMMFDDPSRLVRRIIDFHVHLFPA